MVELDSRVRRYGEVTLVEVVVTNDGEVPRRVLIASELDGAVWPPRTRGLPAAEWDGDALSVGLDPDERRSFGFASPAPPVDPPVRIECERAVTDGGAAVTAADVVRTLGDPRPPRDAVPGPNGGSGVPVTRDAAGGEDRRDTRVSDDADGERETAETGTGEDADGERETAETGTGEDADGERETGDDGDEGERRQRAAATPPPAVRAWFAAVERRIDGDQGGDENGDERHSPTEIERPDPAVLRSVARRARSLADRAAADGSRESSEGSA